MLTANEIDNWIAIYTATAICCSFAFVLSVSTVGIEIWKERSWREVRTVRGALLVGPKLWWRWQKRYLLSTPVTLAIVASFALTLDWTG